MSQANKQQVGGTHYKTDYEHWDLMLSQNRGIDYLIGQATKYVSRWRKKNGMQDLQKALHFVNKLIENRSDVSFSHFDFRDGGQFHFDTIARDVTRFAQCNGLTDQERDFCILLIRLDSLDELYQARDLLLSIMETHDELNPPDAQPTAVPLEDSNRHAEREGE
jgi:hypothetical protein